MSELFKMNMQLFGAAGDVITGTTAYINSTTSTVEKYEDSGVTGMSPTMKEYYNTELLENARSELVFAQFGKKQPLPANNGRVVEWRKFNTLGRADALVEGVIPSGERMGMTSLTGQLEQYGMYVAITDLLELHAIDNVLLGATEELGASAGETKDHLIRDVLCGCTNVMYCDTVAADGTKTAVNSISEMDNNNNRLTPDMVNKAVTWLKKCKAPKINGKFVAIIHPSVAYDLRSAPEWIEAHKYAATTEIFNGEIGELHGVRFVETTNAKITKNPDTDLKGIYDTIFLGKDAYGIIDPEGGSMEMIIKNKGEAGGPLEQYSTAGYKFEDATKILYPERMVRVLSCSTFSAIDEEN